MTRVDDGRQSYVGRLIHWTNPTYVNTVIPLITLFRFIVTHETANYKNQTENNKKAYKLNMHNKT